MANSNDFLAWATGTSPNVESQAAYLADATRNTGEITGKANSARVNKAIRQGSITAAMIAQFTADFGPSNVVDDGNIANLESQFEAALQTYLAAYFQKILLVSTTFFIDLVIGSDTLYDGTSDTISGTHGPWATLTHALAVMATLNLNGNTATIQLANPGTYPSPSVRFSAPGNGTLLINGSSGNQSSYIISGTPNGSAAVLGITSGNININGLTIANNGGSGTASLSNNNGSSVTVTNVSFDGTQTSGFHMGAYGGSISIGSGCVITKSAAAALYILAGGNITQSANCSVSGSPAWGTACCLSINGGAFSFAAPGGYTFSGSASGPRYFADFNGVINTGGSGASYFPGNAAGTLGAHGGQYG